MRAVNLLPKEFAARKSLREEDPAVVVGSALAVVVLIALGASFLVAQSKANTQQKRLTAARLELGKFSQKSNPTPVKKPAVPITPIVPPPSIVGQEAVWLASVTSTLSQRIAWDRVLREVSLVMPDDVTLASLTMTAPATPGAIPTGPAASAQGFVIAGSAFSYPGVARLLSRLGLVPDLSNVTLTSTTSSSKTGVDFSITASVKGAVAPAAPVATTPAVTTTTATTTGAGT
jgi:Tfp pilus assembly protein PilN